MPPAIVYTDMADPVGGADGVFTDLNFFIVQRVPQRSHYVSLVESNGGRVVKLEAQADYLIADHMRHDAPAGSLTYKFIEEAIKLGEIPDDENFIANRRKSANTTITATCSKKSTRTPFTDDDDKLLYALVHKADHQGYSIQGNSLYQLLAAHNTRHTMHSWRDRYIKVLAFKPPTAWESYPDANLPSLDTPLTELPSTALPRSTSRSTITSTHKSRLHTPFTDEDDKQLRAWITNKTKQGASLSGNVIYRELEARNPRHTLHSWRDRWVRHLRFQEPDDDYDGIDEDIAPQEADEIGPPVEQVTPAQAVTPAQEVTSAQEVTAALTYPLPKPPTSKTPLKKRPSFRIPPGASASITTSIPADDESRVAPAAAKAPTTPIEPLAANPSPLPATSPPDIVNLTTTRSVASSKNQANTPMVRSRNLSSPIMSQKTSAQAQSSHDDSSFTEQEFEDLLSAALDIQNVCVGRYQESWIRWAEFEKGHTAVEWRSFYERRVLPVVLQKEHDSELPVSQSTGRWAEFWQNQGQPIDILPYESAEKVSAPQSAKRKVQNPIETVEEPATKRQRTATPPHSTIDLALPQPIADGVADISGKDAPSPSLHYDQEREEEEETPEDEAAIQLRREMAEDKDDRHQLTRANLARIQAENGLPEENRGVDIEADDEDDDQADFATYLASMLPPNLKERALETVEVYEYQVNQAHEVEEEEEEDEDIVMNNGQHEIEYEIDPALLEVDSELESPSYKSSAEFQANNTNIHLDVPTTQPWEASSLPSQSQSQPQQSQRHQQLSTQAIFEAETQSFDAEVPLPPDELYKDVEVSYTTAQTDSQILSEDEIWPWVDSQIAIGHAEETVFSALRATSMNPKLAAMVLEAKGQEIDVAGVWTEEDDRVAEGRDARAIRKLEGKHGKGSVEERITFLAQWRADEEAAMNGNVEE